MPGPGWFGFKDDWALVHRFRARYRLSKVCKGLRISGYSSATEGGYHALTRTFLCWSTFELFLRVAQLRGDAAIATLLDKHGADGLLKTFAAVPGYEKFFKGIEENLDRPKHRAAVAAFLAGKPCDPGRVLGAVRHIFAHGFLTPNTGGIEATDSASICNQLADFILSVVDAEWRQAVEFGVADWEAQT